MFLDLPLNDRVRHGEHLAHGVLESLEGFGAFDHVGGRWFHGFILAQTYQCGLESLPCSAHTLALCFRIDGSFHRSS